MFIPCKGKTGTAYFEFQYCKKEWTGGNFMESGYSYWEEDSLLIHVDEADLFFDQYGKYFRCPQAVSGVSKLEYCGENYYSKEQTAQILQRIKKECPQEHEPLIAWLEKAVTEYNGFFMIGI